MIELDCVSKSYGRFQAVRGVSLKAAPGEVTALLGPNGAGKTTILKTICAQFLPDSGTARVCGKDTADNPAAVKSLIGYVSEQPALYPDYTVSEFLHFVIEVRSRADALALSSQKAAIAKTAAVCALERVLHQKISTLSKGYAQRVSFAQALIADPPVLILDEPISGLDPAQIHHIRSLIASLAANGKTVLLSTHLLPEAQSLCRTFYIIADGKIAASGTAAEICSSTSSKNLEDAFIALTGEAGA
ncbi:MAG TPA: ABC transporter ATP-binding protein [Candidatus Treponema faecavium]|nr:ABC transporter ATP-binding protein [Candidatus Treponema faecavium]